MNKTKNTLIQSIVYALLSFFGSVFSKTLPYYIIHTLRLVLKRPKALSGGRFFYVQIGSVALYFRTTH